jgi:hypothetical protein
MADKIIRITWGHPKYGVDDGYWKGPIVTRLEDGEEVEYDADELIGFGGLILAILGHYEWNWPLPIVLVVGILSAAWLLVCLLISRSKGD